MGEAALFVAAQDDQIDAFLVLVLQQAGYEAPGKLRSAYLEV